MDTPTSSSSSTTTNRFRLDTLPKPHDVKRPTIPYAQFPRPTLPHLPTSHEQASRGLEHSAHKMDVNVDPDQPSGYRRRRRSSLLNSTDGEGPTPRMDEQNWGEGQEGPGHGSGDESVSEDLEMNDFSDDEGLTDDEETGLTGQDRGKGRGGRRRDTALHQRIAGDSKITREEEHEANQTMIRRLAINGLLISLWYLFSLSISLYNTWMFSKNHLNFPFPLFTTSMHMLVQFTLASLVMYFLPRFRPRYNSISNVHNIHLTDADRAAHAVEEKKPLMTRWFYGTRLGPCGMATGLDIGLGNMSLQTISLSFYTMCKSSSLAFVLIFAFLFRLEPPSWRLVAIIATMTVGVIMMVFGEVDFDALGFVLVSAAAFFSGFRWALTQILLLHNPATSNPFANIFFLAPIMFATMILLAVPVEGISALASGFGDLVAQKGIFLGPGLLLFPGMIAFCMTASEFALLQRSSVVTLSIAGIFKEVVTIAAAGIIFDDHLTPINISGLFVTIGAIAAYNWIKIRRMREDVLEVVHEGRLGEGRGSEREGEEHDGLIGQSGDGVGSFSVAADADEHDHEYDPDHDHAIPETVPKATSTSPTAAGTTDGAQ